MHKKSEAQFTTPTGPALKALSHDPWALIEVGATVLYRENKGEGWFECKVVEIKDPKMLTLKWRDYPLYKPFDVRRIAVGLICKVT